MSILSTIFGKLFPSAHAGNAPTTVSTASGPTSNAALPTATVLTATPMAEVDVERQLDDMVSMAPEKYNWRTSIVDLMKLLGIDSSLTSRKELAQELKYSGDMNDSASMNTWLHRQVMTEVAANGGKVPADLKD